MTDRIWTVEDLDRVHPIEDESDEGWTWKLDEDGRPFAVNGDRARIMVDSLGRLCCDDIDGDNANVALAVILASKGLDSLEAMAVEVERRVSNATLGGLLGVWRDVVAMLRRGSIGRRTESSAPRPVE
jgi:hypothetical protein